jgi:hypothetical protein
LYAKSREKKVKGRRCAWNLLERYNSPVLMFSVRQK